MLGLQETWPPELRRLVRLWEAYNELARETGHGCAELGIEAFVKEFNALEREGHDMSELCRREDRCRVCETCAADGVCLMTFESLRSVMEEMQDELDRRERERELEYDRYDDDPL
jgi:hypothetical protein